MNTPPADPAAARIGGLTPFSSCDWPGKLCAVVFLAGCPWRCGYCHNPHLLRRQNGETRWPDTLRWLQSRVGLLDGVVFSGGEPLQEPALPALLEQTRALGFATGLHTGGAYPQRLRRVLPLLDWVGLDIKTDFSAYPALTGLPRSGEQTEASLHCLLQNNSNFECRSSIHPHWHNEIQLAALARRLAALGVADYHWQQLRPPPSFALPPAPAGWPAPQLIEEIAPLFQRFSYREH
ncbi:anaerobic ribonucleoside-triphosphate reductase activating protein [Chromobacterium sp. S0633]|uniref:anaerobic ribonucleoside-triphosphate reductase activating protein n=1 Tax=Chromobacterium sp. S0633 TaxID=2957805 RepID=UPI00209F5B6D|nr:anaerobic ribonucleoside-triphosphate reductase activating protein [Chromobacterium sp. S0633]